MKKVTEFKKSTLNSLGERIRAERTSKRLSQDELATKIHLSRQQINYFETDSRKPDIDKLILIADALNVSTDYLLCRIESKAIENVNISSKIGLSDKSINKLSSFINDSFNIDVLYCDWGNYQDFPTIINKIIENKHFEKLIYFIRAYINSFKKEELKKEIKYNSCPEVHEYLHYDDETFNEIGYDKDYDCTTTDTFNYKINKIYNNIIDDITNDLKASFSNRWTLNDEKTKILAICKDGSEEFKFYKGRGIKSSKKGVVKKNGSKRINKK